MDQQTCPKRLFPVQKRKFEDQRRIQHIRISFSTNFYLKQKIINFPAKFARKRYFPSREGQKNITIELSIFKLVYNSGKNIWESYSDFAWFLTAQKMKFSIKDFFSKCDQIRRKQFTFCQIFYPGLSKETNFFSKVVPVSFER